MAAGLGLAEEPEERKKKGIAMVGALGGERVKPRHLGWRISMLPLSAVFLADLLQAGLPNLFFLISLGRLQLRSLLRRIKTHRGVREPLLAAPWWRCHFAIPN